MMGNIGLWSDPWISEVGVAHKYPRLFINSCQREKYLGNVGEWFRAEHFRVRANF